MNGESLKKLKNILNLDLKYLCKWLKANKISLNASKTELIIFHHPNKPTDYDIKIKIDGKKLLPSEFVKYLGITIDSHLNWLEHSITLCNKLARAVGMLSKIRHFVSFSTLKSVYFGIFSSVMSHRS